MTNELIRSKLFIKAGEICNKQHRGKIYPVNGKYPFADKDYSKEELIEILSGTNVATIAHEVVEQTLKPAHETTQPAKVAHEKSKKVKPLRTKVDDWHKIVSKADPVKPSKHSGEHNSKFKGYYVINNVQYPSSRVASTVTGIPARTIQSKCKASFPGFSFQPL